MGMRPHSVASPQPLGPLGDRPGDGDGMTGSSVDVDVSTVDVTVLDDAIVAAVQSGMLGDPRVAVALDVARTVRGLRAAVMAREWTRVEDVVEDAWERLPAMTGCGPGGVPVGSR